MAKDGMGLLRREVEVRIKQRQDATAWRRKREAMMDGQPMGTAPSGAPIEARDPERGWAIAIADGPRWRILADMHRAFDPVEWRPADPAEIARLMEQYPWARRSYGIFCTPQQGGM